MVYVIMLQNTCLFVWPALPHNFIFWAGARLVGSPLAGKLRELNCQPVPLQIHVDQVYAQPNFRHSICAAF